VAGKLTANQQRRVDEIQQHLRTVEKIRRLVAELESSRAAKPVVIGNISSAIERELSQMRQRALTANVGTLADQAGALAVLAGRSGGGLAMKLRGLQEGVAGMTMQLDQALKAALSPDERPSPGDPAAS
jgi:hypothetical protein